MSEKHNLIVLGGGPGGYVAAIRASQLGARVVVVDDAEYIGGVCLNWGCIPTKALLDSAEKAEFLARAAEHGFEVEAKVDFAKVMKRSREVVARLGKGTAGLLQKNKVEVVKGRGKVVDFGVVAVGEKKIEAEKILIATGAKPRLLPGVEPDGKRIFTSREILEIASAPKSLLILGAGAIGLEFACFFHAFGTKVTVVEMEDRVLPVEDPEVSETLGKILARKGYDIRTGRRVERIETKKDGVVVTAGGEGIEGEAALVALGVIPNTKDLFEEGLAPRTDAKGWIETGPGYRTSIPGIYAIGDVIGPPWLAHVASDEGIHFAEAAFGDRAPDKIDYASIPSCTYTHPQVASIGLTEPAARAKYGDALRVGSFPLAASGRAIASGETDGFVKLLFAPEEAGGHLVGAHILGAEATEMIAEAAMAMRLEATPEDFAETVHAHPTLAEASMEAALAAMGRGIHI